MGADTKIGWHAGEFSVSIGTQAWKRAGMEHEVKRQVPIAGWINGLFALDFRVMLDMNDEYRKGWVLTHLPTGFIVVKLGLDRDAAIAVADEIAACADWNFTDPAGAKPISAAVKPIFDRLGDDNLRACRDIGPVWHDSPLPESTAQ
jgi:hypothetical protein